MYRTLFRSMPLRSLASTLRPVTLSNAALRIPAVSALAPKATPFLLKASRLYSSSAGLEKSEIEQRVLEVLKSFEKVQLDKVTTNSDFTSDLGLDSLDAVEVVMAIEEEFSIEIPDEEADKITTVGQAIDYVAHVPEAI